MSFALEVKEEIVTHSFNHDQKLAYLSGFIRYSSDIIFSNQAQKIRFSTISNKIARTLLSFTKEFFNGEVEISIIQSQVLKKNKTFVLTLIGDVDKFLQDLKIYNKENQKIYDYQVDESIKDKTSIIRAYIAGIFTAVGSVNSPKTSNYHLELQFKSLVDADRFMILTKDLGFDFKLLERNANRFICYLKRSIMVSDFLKLIDATNSVLAFENERISRDVYNSINRVNNIDISNQTKVLKAGKKQVEMINYLKESNQFHLLSKKAQVLAEIRIQNPDYSYIELVEEMNQKGYSITKSGVSNLFRTMDKYLK
ncbi:DNA-binding protein WhiA [Mycoplasma yeatsii]|uniref:Probable cell division protein WhiA n=1 Tax=Mycoplasma yeatsii TaxID=51365 RepID=A0ABU0NDA6_9MOLU|nr:DNA-binding protein WhiA [Mycoplasma yeatsii]MDQ0567405.1 DNA-binding protein WhiA [Mycoplasma yeatsii]